MKITVATTDDRVFSLDVSPDMELMNFKVLCEMETGIPILEIGLFWNGRPLLDDSKSFEHFGITEGEMILIQQMRGGPPPQMTGLQSGGGGGLRNRPAVGAGMIDFSNIQIPGASTSSGTTRQSRPAPPPQSDDPATVREMFLASPRDLALLKERNVELSDALHSGSLEKFAEVFKRQRAELAEKERERIAMINADPFDPEAQKKIAEEIRLKNVESNMETAMEYAPESFGQVIMLYINCIVNGYPVKAFVDSGAQMTIMSQACAERCHINRLVDTRWAGIAKGVGTQKIIGRVHLGQIQIGDVFLPSSFSILEDQPMDMLLGLDMLKRHQCSIDLKNNKLVIGTTQTETPFLTESEVPDHAKLNRRPESDLEQDDHALAQALAKSAQEQQPSTAGVSSHHNTSSSSAAAAGAQFPEKDIQKLVANGFTREQCVAELTRTRGNVDEALASLIAKSIQIPTMNS
ncbi:protein DDI1 homolog 2-like [Tubulanus polymorphus]|uniref:protein DDI1 homolog 2-like n=1 Tax=Tubulanus polymorphus TaxID=672921 RepID=UPI003DA40EAD